jgi:glycosyltransferase involved in cell wall biosynthesis
MDAMPALSVIIPTRNRATMLQRCLTALANQSLPASEFEVIVVVDGSSDDTAEMLRAQTSPFSLTHVVQPNRGGAAARNEGVSRARAALCVFLDDDVLADPALLAEHLRLQREQGPAVSIGRLVFVPESTARFAQYIAERWQRHAEALSNGRGPSFGDCWSGNICVPRAALEATNGFAEDLRRNYDVELGFRLHRHGLRFVYVPTAVARHVHAGGTATLAREFEQNGREDVLLLQRHPAIRDGLWLGRFKQMSARARLALRLLLWARIPLRAVLATGRFDFAVRYAYWRGVRAGVDRTEWRALVSAG